MIPRGLSLLQAPPFSVIARFFITFPLFGVLSSILAFSYLIKEPFNLPALVHTFTLGLMASVMLGALFQMLPVVAGAVIENPLPKAEISHLSLVLGTLLLIFGFLSGQSLALWGSLLLLAGGLYFTAFLMFFKLIKLKSYTPTSKGMKFALGLFTVGISCGVLMVLSLLGTVNLNYGFFLNAHISFLLFGWVCLLIASVAFQVIEMFFVTPPYPKNFSNLFPLATTFFVLLNTFFESFFTKILISLLFLSFAVLTIERLLKRRRKIPDPLISLWYLGMGFLLMAMILYPFTDKYEIFLLFLLLFGNFALSVIMAMSYRIIPFLVWFHLSAEGSEAPTMYEIIKPSWIWFNYRVHLIASFLSVISFILEYKILWLFALAFYTFSFLLLFTGLLKGCLKYFKKPHRQSVSLQR